MPCDRSHRTWAPAALLLALLFAALTLMFILNTFLALWLSALITTLVLGVVAGLGFWSANQQFKRIRLVPERFLRTLREDVNWIGNLKASSSR